MPGGIELIIQSIVGLCGLQASPQARSLAGVWGGCPDVSCGCGPALAPPSGASERVQIQVHQLNASQLESILGEHTQGEPAGHKCA